MSYKIIPTHRFGKELKRLAKKFPSLKVEFSELLQNLTAHPELGTYIGNNCYKIRLAISSKGKGKSGGARVISYLYVQTETIYLLSIYDKSEKAAISPNELKDMIEGLDFD